MLRRQAGTLISLLGVAAIAAGLGGAAIAGPGGGATALAPTSELSNGAVSAPPSGEPNGAVEAPAVAPTEPAAPAPVESAPPPVAPVPDPTAVEAPPATGPEETVETAPTAPDGEVVEPEEEPAPVDPEIPEVAPPTSEEVLNEDGAPLIPVAMLGARPLIDLTPEPVAAPALEQHAERLAVPAQAENTDPGDDEIIIPIDPNEGNDQNPADEGNGEPGPAPAPAPAPRPVALGRRLAMTGLKLEGPFGVGCVLLLMGGLLRMTARPTPSPARV